MRRLGSGARREVIAGDRFRIPAGEFFLYHSSRMDALPKDLSQAATTLGLTRYSRHIFLCADQTEAKCCSKEAGLAAWEFLKRRLRELQLAGPETVIYRSKANCLRVCCHGPIAVVYPDGVWYQSCTPDVLERIIQEHLMGGRIVREYAFGHNRAMAGGIGSGDRSQES